GLAQTLALRDAGIDRQCTQRLAEGTPARIDAARAADVEQREARVSSVRREAPGNEGGERVLHLDRGDGCCGRADGAGQAERRGGEQEARALLVAQVECQVLQPPDLAEVEAE